MSRSKIITGLDIGTSKIKVLSVIKNSGKDGFEFLISKEGPSAGVKKGIVVDASKTAQAISSIIKEVEQETGQEIENVYANAGGKHIFCVSSKGLVSVSRADQKISESDINRVLQNAQTFPLDSNKEILEIFTKEFIVDGVGNIKEAVGMQGVRLEAEVLAICGFTPYIRNINQSVSESGLDVDGLTPSIIASSKSVLTSKDKDLGVMMLNIGAGTTEMAVYEEGNLIHTASFPVGSGNITNDIAILLRVDIDTAERIKLEFGFCGKSKTRKKGKKIKIEGEEGISFTEKELSQIIEARVSEILNLANEELKKISREKLLPSGVVLIGGGAKLPNIKEFTKNELKLPCRIGPLKDFPAPEEDISFGVAWGLILEGEETERPDSRSVSGISFLKKVLRIFKP